MKEFKKGDRVYRYTLGSIVKCKVVSKHDLFDGYFVEQDGSILVEEARNLFKTQKGALEELALRVRSLEGSMESLLRATEEFRNNVKKVRDYYVKVEEIDAKASVLSQIVGVMLTRKSFRWMLGKDVLKTVDSLMGAEKDL